MSIVLVKQPAFIAGPANNPADTFSGMQRATASTAIGNRETVDGVLVAGQDIGKAAGASYLRVTTV